MVPLSRPPVPAKLQRLHTVETNRLWDQHRGGQKIMFKGTVYGLAKSALLKSQGSKCAYCEIGVARSHPPVEHYRPKAGWRQNRSDILKKPGYFWLTYNWDNLFVSCNECNDQGHKANLFPLLDPTFRAHPGNTDHGRESPLILDPYQQDPSLHIRWKDDLPIGITLEGKTTIQVFKLDVDEDLVDARREVLADFEHDLIHLESISPFREKDRVKLTRVEQKICHDPKQQFAAMLRANFRVRVNSLLARIEE